MMSKVMRILLLLLTSFMISISSVESRNDVTSWQSYICDTVHVSPQHPYMRNVNSMLDDLAMGAPAAQDREQHMACQYQGTVAFGYAYCQVDGVSLAECFQCLTAANNLLYNFCGPSIGAQILMTLCYVRYDYYRFM